MVQRGRPKGSKDKVRRQRPGSSIPVVSSAPSSLDIITSFSEKQQVAIRQFMSHKFTLFGGAVGGGKSYFIRWSSIWYLMYLAAEWKLPNPRGMVCSSTYKTLADRQMSRFAEEIPSSLGKFYSKHSYHQESFILAPQFGGGVIHFRNLDDPDKYKSNEYAFIAVEEASENDLGTFNALRRRLRCPGLPDGFCRMLLGSNPGGIGHGWLKALFMDGLFGKEWAGHEQEFAFVKSLVEDNPFVDPSYKASLDTLPDLERRALRDGDWNVFAGQAFSHVSELTHGIEPYPIPDNAQITMTYDWGMGSPFSIGWWFTDNDGRVIRFAEWYGSASGGSNRGLNLTDEQVALGVKEREREMGFWDEDGNPTRDIDRLTGHDCFARRSSSASGLGPSTAEVWAKHGMFLRQGDHNRELGYRQMHERLKIPEPVLAGESEGLPPALRPLPMMVAFEGRCPEFFRQLSNLPTDPTKNHNDVNTKAEDHLYDECRHIAMSRPLTPAEPEEIYTTRGALVRATVAGLIGGRKNDLFYPEEALETR